MTNDQAVVVYGLLTAMSDAALKEYGVTTEDVNAICDELCLNYEIPFN